MLALHDALTIEVPDVEVYEAGQPGLGGVLLQGDRGADPDREGEHDGEHADVEGAAQALQDPGVPRLRPEAPGEEVAEPAGERAAAGVDHVEDQHAEDDDGCGDGDDQEALEGTTGRVRAAPGELATDLLGNDGPDVGRGCGEGPGRLLVGLTDPPDEPPGDPVEDEVEDRRGGRGGKGGSGMVRTGGG